ncbi:hypothetical protein WJX82_001892 [Trebouxia sp. C0006]
MTGAPEAPAVHSATAATEDQTAESAAPSAEPANASAAETEASNEPEQEPEHVQEKAKIAASKTKATPAKPVASEPQQSAEQPSGRRERKQTNFFQPEKKIETEKLEIREGQGTKLGEIPNVAFQLSKVTGRDELLEDLHQILYARKGKLSTRKKDIQAFSGFAYTDDQQEAELEKAKGLLSRFKNDHMTRLLDLLDIPRSDLKDKEAKVEKVLHFLKAPSKLSDKDLAAKEVDKKAAAARKRQRKEKDKEAKPKRAKKSKESTAEGEGEEDKEEEEQADGAAAAEAKEDDEEDEKPLQAMVPKKKKLPSEKTLQQEILQTLSGVNVLEFNIKMLMQHLNEKYDKRRNRSSVAEQQHESLQEHSTEHAMFQT